MTGCGVFNRFKMPGRMLAAGIILCGALYAAPSPAQAQAARTLPPEERYQLNLRRWQGMTDKEREAIRRRVAALSPEERRFLKDQLEKFRALPLAERQALREQFRRFRTLPPKKREALRQKYRRFRALPPERQEEIIRRFREKQAAQKAAGTATAVRQYKVKKYIAERKVIPREEYRVRAKEYRIKKQKEINKLRKKKRAQQQKQQKKKPEAVKKAKD